VPPEPPREYGGAEVKPRSEAGRNESVLLAELRDGERGDSVCVRAALVFVE
jgi:hypothetical protein